MRNRNGSWLLAVALCAWTVSLLHAAPFAEKIPFEQPDGTLIELWGEGDEFHAVFETLDGYTVVFDTATKAYHYATLSADGSELVSTGTQVGRAEPTLLLQEKHLRINPGAAREQIRERVQRWDRGMAITQRWQALKSARRQGEVIAADGTVMAPPSSTTTGNKVGLCLLIDFDDDPATIPQSEIDDFCNADNYTGFGNNGSVKRYFLDNSNSLLTYTNIVTVYIRIPNSLHPKSW